MLAVLLAPLTWLVCLQMLFALVPWSCRHGALPGRVLFPAIALVLVGASAASLAVGWRALQSVRRASAGPARRTHFMALVNLGSGALFIVVALAAMVPMLMLGPCE